MQGLGAIDAEEIATGEREPPAGGVALREYNKLKRRATSIMLSSITKAIQPHVTAHRANLARMLEILDGEYNSTRSLASTGRLKENFSIEIIKKDDTLSSYIARLI